MYEVMSALSEDEEKYCSFSIQYNYSSLDKLFKVYTVFDLINAHTPTSTQSSNVFR